MTSKLVKVGSAILLIALAASGQEHKWAGRALNETEWRIHEELAMLPFHGVFETLDFEVRDKTVVLSGHVMREAVKANAERVIKRLDSVETVINQIELLPPSKRDDAIRMRVYRAIYETQPAGALRDARFPSNSHCREGRHSYSGRHRRLRRGSKRRLSQSREIDHHVVNDLRVALEE